MNKAAIKKVAVTGLSALAVIFVLRTIGNRVPAVNGVVDKAMTGV